MKRNKVAEYLKDYALVNAGCGVLLVVIMMANMNLLLSVLIFFATVFTSGLIYGVGEIVDLLEEIRWNTRPKDLTEPQPEPEQESELEKLPATHEK